MNVVHDSHDRVRFGRVASADSHAAPERLAAHDFGYMCGNANEGDRRVYSSVASANIRRQRAFKI